MSGVAKRRLRAPVADGAALIEPPLAEIGPVLARNRKIIAEFPLASGFATSLVQQARDAFLDSPRIGLPARHFDPSAPLIATGHQPELYHPGVWFKNFVAAAIAGRHRGNAANLVVDNDLVRIPGIRVPTLNSGEPQVSQVLFDAPIAESTWEHRYLASEETFRQFSANVRQVFEPLSSSKDYRDGIILDRLWPHAIHSLEEQNRQFAEFENALASEFDLPSVAYPKYSMLSQCLTAARQQLESDLGLTIANTAASEIADQRPFFEFVRLLLLRHRELFAIHNQALAEYRVVNRIRSHSHPVPALARQADWFEMPLWVGTFGSTGRQRVYVRTAGGQFEITDGGETTVSLPLQDSSDYRSILMSQRVTLRPRALVTTLYARLVLSDLFIHGIGGAKYDELTDLIIERFFGVEPPQFMTATATFRLPIERPEVTAADVRQSAERLRDFLFRPEAFLRQPRVKHDRDLEAQLGELALEKREFLAAHDLRRCSREVYERLAQINAKMRDVLAPVERELRAEHAELIEALRQSQLLGSREFSFVLFPSEILPARLLDLCKVLS